MTEMDKVRDVRRGASRFSKQSGRKLSSGLNGGCAGGDFGSLEKSKKERVKRLSAVCKDSSSYEEMGCCDFSYREDEHHPSVTNVGSGKRFKLPKKFFDDCNRVNTSPVPRKLRSAMKKRNRESVSPPLQDSKKLNQVIGEAESPQKDGPKKSRLNMKRGGRDRSRKQAGSGPITKDEEEVVETLYSLAGMFHDIVATDLDKLDGEKAASPALPEAWEGASATLTEEGSVAVKEDLSCPSGTAEPNDPSSNVPNFPEEAVEVDSLNQPVIQEQSNLPDSENVSLDLDSVVPELNSQVIPLLVKNGGEKPLYNAIDLCIPPKQNRETSILKDANKEESSPLQQKPEPAFGLAMALGVQMNQPQMRDKEPKKIALWPGLSSTFPNGAPGHGPPQCPSNAKVPASLDTSVSVTGKNSFENGSSSGKVSQAKNGKISQKRCATHVYISHQIRALKMPDSHPNQLRQHEIPKQGVFVGVNNFNGVRSGLDGVSSAISSGNCQDQPHGSLASREREYPSPKQGFDFLSLSAGNRGIETSNGLGRTVDGSEQSSRLQVPYFQSRAQHPMLMSLSAPQIRYTSAYPDQPASATQQAQLQLHHPYLGRPFYGRNTSTASLTKQQQQLQYQQRFWTAQLASQYRPAGASASMTPIPSWHTGRQDSSALIPCSQPAIPPSSSSLELLGPKYPQISLQQQHLMAISSSLPPAGVKRQDHHLYSVYEETRGSFRANGALPLQLLCNESL